MDLIRAATRRSDPPSPGRSPLAVLVGLSLLAGLLVVGAAPSPRAHAADQFDVNVTGPRGPVTVIGDSVLVGAGRYSPTLPDRLVERGWGPIRFRAAGSATSGLFDVSNEFRSSHWISLWKLGGWDPKHVIVNLGTNDSGFCGTNATCAYDTIMHLVDAIGPGHEIWWPTITKPAAATRDTFNAALRRVEAERTDFHVWDWYAEFSAGGYRSGDQIHLDPASYVRRSERMADVFTETFSGAIRVGGDAPLPAAGAPAGTYLPIDPQRIVDTRPEAVDPGASDRTGRDPGDVTRDGATRDGTTQDGATQDDRIQDGAIQHSRRRPAAGDTVRVDLGDAVAAESTAVALYVAAVQADAPGYLSAGPCGSPPSGATVNYRPGGAFGAPAVTAVGNDGDVCIFTSESVDVIVDLRGAVVPDDSGLRLTPLDTPVRMHDTRPTGRITELRIDVGADGAGSGAVADADAVAVNLAAVGADGGGFLTAGPCGSTTDVASLNFTGPSPVSASAFVELDDDGAFCIVADRPVDVIVDLTAVLAPDARLEYVPVVPTRTLDTRVGVGGWAPVHGAGQTLDVGVAPADAEAVTGTLTVVRPATTAYATAYGCVGSAPTASVNVTAGSIAANAVTTGVFGGRLCIFSSAMLQTVFDTTGWWVIAT